MKQMMKTKHSLLLIFLTIISLNFFSQGRIDGFFKGKGKYDFGGTLPNAPSFRELKVEYTRIGGTIYKPFGKRIGAYLGGYYNLTGRNVSQGLGINGGLVFKLSGKNE